MNIERSEEDRLVYERELMAFLPDRVFDAHVHLFDRSCLAAGHVFPPKSPYRKFGGAFTRDQYLDWTRALLPEQTVHLNAFGHPARESDRDASAACAGGFTDNRRFFGMALVAPEDEAADVRRRVEAHRLIGLKPYHALVVGRSADDVTIPDMLPGGQMCFAHECGLAVTLHIPRSGRLADPLNQVHVVQLCRRYPNARIVFAHIGRAYFLQNVVGFLDGLAACPNAYLDTAMVNHEGVLEYAFRTFPRERILFGSDAPIAFLRGKSVEINHQYAYLMAEDYEIGTSIHDARHAVRFTTFLYEQIRGIGLAARRAGLSRADVEGIFFSNAQRLFGGIAAARYGAA
jgi:predicted TIM-barrel fold metal-dependent hydrolase